MLKQRDQFASKSIIQSDVIMKESYT